MHATSDNSSNSAHTSQRPYSSWALAALLASLAIFCPIATLIAPLLALRALVAIKANPHLRGKKIAITASIVGIVASVLSISGGLWFASWWNRAVRSPMLQSPITQATINDPVRFNQMFISDQIATSDADAGVFLAQLRTSLGTLREVSVIPDYVPPASPKGEFPVSYLIHGDFADIPATAYFVIVRDGRGPFITKFDWLCVIDPQTGALYFPPNRKDEAVAFINRSIHPPASQPQVTSGP